MSEKGKKEQPVKPRKLPKKELDNNIRDFNEYIEEEMDRSGKTKKQIIEDIFKDPFLTWSPEDLNEIAGRGNVNESFDGMVDGKAVKLRIPQKMLDDMIEDVRKNPDVSFKDKETAIATMTSTYIVQETNTGSGGSGTIGGAQPLLTAWAMPNVPDDVDEYRRLRREFAPIARGVDYVKGMIIGSKLDVQIDDAEDKYKGEIRDELEEWMRELFQDQYTPSAYTLLSILVDEALTVGAAGAEIRYENSDFKFDDFVLSTEQASFPISRGTTPAGKEFVFFKTKEPDWKKLNGIKQLKIIKNAHGRMKLYRDPKTWEANYWTLDEIVSSGDTQMAIHQLEITKDVGKTGVKFHPWQVFWLNLNRRDFDEFGLSIVAPAKHMALILERIMLAVGEGCHRAGNRKYFIVCGNEKNQWGKPHIRNVMQEFNEMGKKNWTAIPVPAGFDIKEIGGTVFEANQVMQVLLQQIAQAMHVPLVMIIQARAGTEAEKEQFTASFNEIEQMRFEFRQAVERQLFQHQLWCTHGKTRTKQGGKGTDKTYIPELKLTTKGLLNPIDKLIQIVGLLNVANPVRPEIKLELERDLAGILGYDDIKLPTQEELRKELKDASKANPLAKTQGQPEPQTLERQQERLEGGVNKTPKGTSKSMGSTRIPEESKAEMGEAAGKGAVSETLATEMTTDIPQRPTQYTPDTDIKAAHDLKVGGNYGPFGYFEQRNVVQIGKGGNGKQVKLKYDSGTGQLSFVNPLTQQTVTIVRVDLSDGIAGYSLDGFRIYIDTAVPDWMILGLITHETLEMELVEVLDFSYEWSHIQATKAERHTCDELGIDWKEYDGKYHELLKLQEQRKPMPKDPSDIHHGVYAHTHHLHPKIKSGKGGDGKVQEVADETASAGQKQTGVNDKPQPTQSELPQSTSYEAHETKPQQVDINLKVTTESKPQELKITTESKSEPIRIVTESESKVLDSVQAQVAEKQTELANKELELLEKKKELEFEENKRKHKKLELDIIQTQAVLTEKRAHIDEIAQRIEQLKKEEASQKQINESVQETEKQKQETEKKRQEVIDEIKKKIEAL